MLMSIRAVIAISALAFFTVSGNARASGAGQTQDTAQATSGATAAVPVTSTATSPSPADVAPLTSLAMAGPLTAAAPNMFDAGPFGKLAVNGVLSGFGAWQSHPAPNDEAAQAAIGNGQIFLQKASGVVQFYLQAGAYNFPSLGTPVFSTQDTITDFYGALPVAYLKLAPKGPFSLMAGKLPTLIGAEYTFTFENVNIERGLLWNQEDAITRGLQVNYTENKLGVSLAWNDGFYSDRWNWLTVSVSYAFSAANSLSFVAGGNLGHTAYSTVSTPAYQSNSSIYNVIYTHTAKRWILQPYFQFTHVPTYLQIGVGHATSTQGEAILGSYMLPHHMFLAGRLEYVSSTGNANDGSVNLLYGPGSRAGSVTITPTYQNKAFFARAEVSYVRVGNSVPGDAFGPTNSKQSQTRGMIETGFLF